MITSQSHSNMTSALVISNLPTVLTKEESQDLLSHFHADEVHVFRKCRKKKAIYARFPTAAAACHALQELHQAKLGGSRLIVEYASDNMTPKAISGEEDSSSAADLASDRAECLASFPFPSPLLRYAYPPPSPDTLARICAALRSSPRFYTQVLHLMNKLSLPAPFAGSAVTLPAAAVAAASAAVAAVPGVPSVSVSGDAPPPRPPPLTTPMLPPMPPPSVPVLERRDVEVQTDPAESESGSSESEWASDGEAAVCRPATKRRRLDRLPDSARRLRAARLQLRTAPGPAAAAAPVVPLSEVFEARVTVAPSRKPVLRLPAEAPAPQPATNGSVPPAVEGGFAKLYPSREAAAGDVSAQEKAEEESEFITDRQLLENRLSVEDQKILPVFARYSRGEVSARLYIKNLDKRVVSADLRRVFGRYVDWTDDQHKNAFDIRLMQEGRMKGQAFISLPNTAAAERALTDTHGFILRDKPMVVQFARSARPKDAGS